jgi:hypothetical protein
MIQRTFEADNHTYMITFFLGKNTQYLIIAKKKEEITIIEECDGINEIIRLLLECC